MPQISGAPTDAAVFAHVHSPDHRGSSSLPRHSNETTRPISSTSTSSSAT